MKKRISKDLFSLIPLFPVFSNDQILIGNGLFIVHDLAEICLQGRAAYQAAVDIGLSE